MTDLKKPQRIKDFRNYYKSAITVYKYAITVDMPPFSKMSASRLQNSLFYNSGILEAGEFSPYPK